MILKHLINPKPTIIIFFILFCVGLNIFWLLGSENSFQHENIFINSIIIIITLLITPFHALGLNNLIYEKNIIKKDNLVLGFTYILLCSPFHKETVEWITSFLLIFYINFLFESYQKDYPLSSVFNASFLLCIACMVSPVVCVFLPIVFITNFNYNNLTLRSILVTFLGFFLPLIFYVVFCILFKYDIFFPEIGNIQIIDITSIQSQHILEKIWLIVVSIISLLSFLELFKWLYKKSIRSRLSFIIILIYFCLTIFLTAITELKNLYYMITPLSIVITNFFIYTKRRKFANTLFMLLLISSVIYRFFITI